MKTVRARSRSGALAGQDLRERHNEARSDVPAEPLSRGSVVGLIEGHPAPRYELFEHEATGQPVGRRSASQQAVAGAAGGFLGGCATTERDGCGILSAHLVPPSSLDREKRGLVVELLAQCADRGGSGLLNTGAEAVPRPNLAADFESNGEAGPIGGVCDVHERNSKPTDRFCQAL